MENIMGIGVGVILLNDEGKVLLLLRNNDEKLADSNMHYEGQYTLPAGKVKFGETLEQAAIRKVKAETNLDIKEEDTSVICLLNDHNEYAHYATIGLVVKKYTGDLDLGDSLEHIGYMYADLNNLPLNTCKSSKEIIDRYLNNTFYIRGE